MTRAILILLLLSACAMQPGEPLMEPTPDAQAYSEAHRLLLASLRDPDSARFGKVWRRGETVCGLVNSKNGFGGYTGNKMFAVSRGEVVMEGDAGLTAVSLLAVCAQ